MGIGIEFRCCRPKKMLVALVLGVAPVSAAEPLPTLDELLKTYNELGLPLPPKDAKLVRYENSVGRSINGKVERKTDYYLAFQIKPPSASEYGVFLIGQHEVSRDVHCKPVEVASEPAVVDGIAIHSSDALLAIQCHSRGWGKLAQRILEISQQGSKQSLQQLLIENAWYYWDDQIIKPRSDRHRAAKHLKQILQIDKKLDTKANRALLRSLDLALVPSNAKPGSTLALIDDLVNLVDDEDEFDGHWQPNKRLMAILERAFEAVPDLIDHLDDERLTRCRYSGGINMSLLYSHHMRVGDAVSDLLLGIIGRPKTDEWDLDFNGTKLDKAKIRDWFDGARKIGEERYFVENVLIPIDGDKQRVGINNWQLALIQVKYSKHLPTIYKKVLDHHPKTFPVFANAVKQSKLMYKEKIELLVYAAKNRDATQSATALHYLREMDPKQFNTLLLPAIEALPTDVEPWSGGGPDELGVVQLVRYCDDPNVWQLLEKVARRSKVGFRVMILQEVASIHEGDAKRLERVRLYVGFLDDTTVYDREENKERFPFFRPHDYEKIEVRDFAALQIAAILGLDIKTDPKRTADEWAKIRTKVQQAAKLELEKVK